MHDRQISNLDRLLSGANNFLRTVAAPAGSPARPYPAKDVDETSLSDSERKHAAGLMRVNHAGEIAAQGLYQGHAAVARQNTVESHIHEAAQEEFDHLAWCEQRLKELNSDRSRLAPFWYAGAFAMGAASGILGDKWSLGFIAETEKQVVGHLESHFEKLPADDKRSRAIIEQMRLEEQEHGQDAIDAGAADLPPGIKKLMTMTSKVMTRTAYWI